MVGFTSIQALTLTHRLNVILFKCAVLPVPTRGHLDDPCESCGGIECIPCKWNETPLRNIRSTVHGKEQSLVGAGWRADIL